MDDELKDRLASIEALCIAVVTQYVSTSADPGTTLAQLTGWAEEALATTSPATTAAQSLLAHNLNLVASVIDQPRRS
jgi:hypothetical protein